MTEKTIETVQIENIKEELRQLENLKDSIYYESKNKKPDTDYIMTKINSLNNCLKNLKRYCAIIDASRDSD